MNRGNDIRYLTRKEIDDTKWDACIDKAFNGNIFAYSWYLDHMAGNWDGLVFQNYSGVMALPWRKKSGFLHLYQPAFTGFGGLYGEGKISGFINAIPRKFKLIDIALNAGNRVDDPDIFTLIRQSFFLSLRSSRDSIAAAYRTSTQKNIARAREAGCTVRNAIPYTEVLDLLKSFSPAKAELADNDYNALLRLSEYLKDRVMSYGVYSTSGDLLASCLIYRHAQHIYAMALSSSPNGKTIGAMHLLIDQIINKNAGRDLTLKFEVTDSKSLSFLYTGFGAGIEHYPAIKINRLPWYAKLFY